MEWVEASGKSLIEAKETVLDLLGVAEDDAEFVVLSEPKAGLFGRMRGEARVQARVRPVVPPPKRGRRPRPERRRGASDRSPGDRSSNGSGDGRQNKSRSGSRSGSNGRKSEQGDAKADQTDADSVEGTSGGERVGAGQSPARRRRRSGSGGGEGGGDGRSNSAREPGNSVKADMSAAGSRERQRAPIAITSQMVPVTNRLRVRTPWKRH